MHAFWVKIHIRLLKWSIWFLLINRGLHPSRGWEGQCCRILNEMVAFIMGFFPFRIFYQYHVFNCFYLEHSYTDGRCCLLWRYCEHDLKPSLEWLHLAPRLWTVTRNSTVFIHTFITSSERNKLAITPFRDQKLQHL